MSELVGVLVGLAAGFGLGAVYGEQAKAFFKEKAAAVLEKLNFLK